MKRRIKQRPVGGSIPIDPVGAAHLFVDALNGSDAANGLSAGTAFKTLEHAHARMNEWLQQEMDIVVVIDLAPGTEIRVVST